MKGKRNRFFYRRMGWLFLIGLFHLVFLWAGDILILYAAMGFLLPVFRNVPDKKLLLYSGLLIGFPVLIDTGAAVFRWNLSAPAIQATQFFHSKYGITGENFPVWLAESKSYWNVLQFNVAGSFIRMQEFIEGNRAFKVLGIFLLGLYIGRKKWYAAPEEHRDLLKNVRTYGWLIGFPMTLFYAYSAMNYHAWGLPLHSLLYTVSVVPLSLAYVSSFVLYYLKNKSNSVFRYLAYPGKMALTNYLMQSVFGIFIFYGIGGELRAKTGLVYVELIALAVFILQVFYSQVWLRFSLYGPWEWVWRMLTYGKWLKIFTVRNTI